MRFVRYTCNKKNEQTMREDCKSCPEYDPCGNEGKWCFVGALVAGVENTRMSENMCESITQDVAMPIMRDMSTVTINIGNGQSFDVSREDIIKSIEKELYKGLMLNYGA